MAKIEVETSGGLANPQWMNDFHERQYLVPGGAIVDAASITALPNGQKRVESGTLVSRSAALSASRGAFRPADITDSEFYLVAYTVLDANKNPEVALCRFGVGMAVKTKYLPGYAALSAALKAKIAEGYTAQAGE